MKATISLEELNCGNCITYLTQQLSKIKDIYDISADEKAARVSFIYKSEVAALEAVGIFNSIRKLENRGNCEQNLKIA
ncbi:Heavy-metal-associated domain-containing protein [Salegentibacter holothuriorum]|uniref:Heavy-metal-associated domain-containing protein n=1 Tax=Salegentibacter holothuriorum TaxID=241145 RepID=A0A1T5AYE6_9FLAO|nr:heavy-metal-associated domain-containing protein [Salegentibacter holothuriorum]SKB39780.1 Heavy-metal-associated domain-containing protein [Salegentibacter holothuriorum]